MTGATETGSDVDISAQDDRPITDEDIFEGHLGGKLGIELRAPLTTKRDLSIAYTPGVAKVSLAIAEDPALVDTYTWASCTDHGR